MRTALIFAVIVGLSGCGTPEPFPAMACFTVISPDGVLTKPVTIFLAVEKQDGTRLIDGWAEDAGPGEVYGRHNFPPGTTGPAIAQYYWGLLRNAGWENDVDFVADPAESRIAFAAVTSIEVGDDSDEILVVVKGDER